MILLLIAVKYFIQKIIPDKPQWVTECEEELKARKKQQLVTDDYVKAKDQESEELYLRLAQLEEQFKNSQKKTSPKKRTHRLTNLKPLASQVPEAVKLSYAILDRQLMLARLSQV